MSWVPIVTNYISSRHLMGERLIGELPEFDLDEIDIIIQNNTDFKDIQGGRQEAFLRELGLFCCVFISGLVIKAVEHWFPLLKRMCWTVRAMLTNLSNAESMEQLPKRASATDANHTIYNTSYNNYMAFLRTCSFMFGILAIISAILSILPNEWDYQPWCAGLLGSQISLTGTYDPNGDIVVRELTKFQFAVLVVMTIVYGLVVLIFAWVLQRECQQPALDTHAAEQMDRTLWLKWLPTEDRRQKTSFFLFDEDVQQVEQDLSIAIEDQLELQAAADEEETGPMTRQASRGKGQRKQSVMQRRRTICQRRGTMLHGGRRAALSANEKFIEKIHVLPVVDEWHNTSLELRDQVERAEAYAKKREGTSWPWMRKWYWLKQKNSLENACKLRAKLFKLVRGQKRLSGCAFVTFCTPEQRDRLMTRKGFTFLKLLTSVTSLRQIIRGYSVFNFGRPPFASVTLKCEPAPHPDDVKWSNVHMHQNQRTFRYLFSTFVLLALCVTLVKPSLWSDVKAPLMQLAWFRSFTETVHGLFGSDGSDAIDQLEAFMPTLTLLFINSLLLPFFIELIALYERSKLHSIYENRQLQLNFMFLLINTIILKVVQEDTISALIEKGTSFVDDGRQFWEVCQEMGLLAMKLNGLHFIRYLFSAAFVSNCIMLLTSYRFAVLECVTLAFVSVSPRDRQSAQELSQWPWGYWYAWCLSIIAISLGASVMVPGTLPAGCLFFILKYCVDKYNLKNRIYSCGPENLGVFTTGVVWRMELIVGCFWLGMGFMLYAAAKQVRLQNGQLGIENRTVALGIPVVIGIFGLLVIIQGYIGKVIRTYQQSMHNRTTVRRRKVQEKNWQKNDRNCRCGIDLIWRFAEYLPLRESTAPFQRRRPAHDSEEQQKFLKDLSWDVRGSEMQDYLWMDDIVKDAIDWFKNENADASELEQVERELDQGFDADRLRSAKNCCHDIDGSSFPEDELESWHRTILSAAAPGRASAGEMGSTWSLWDPQNTESFASSAASCSPRGGPESEATNRSEAPASSDAQEMGARASQMSATASSRSASGQVSPASRSALRPPPTVGHMDSKNKRVRIRAPSEIQAAG